ncbi:PadR family transcriptional regulator [Phenylobacterium sp.]|uniref:PadR family transcriptional regulator n=1 Tax=Phenylobacterium sp. TaxID=1871053 RepID=UPI0025F8AB7A|nr:PadR family transcriptional regulator [Phenylobacterium sp.]MBX3483612.1 helix-turn-helix transcriptional regulator [Phenylobacterium sp.]MCW5758883.1 helix-turn-helix transcriptional regulator [Phenylobacterium sp.]
MHRHFHEHRLHRGRHGWGGHGGRHERGERHGRRFGRFFEHGDLRYVVLALLAERSRHGYELIKELEDRTGGAYRPSPGVVYPTLAMLEDEGMIRQTAGDGGRKQFEITDAGRAELENHKATVEALFARMDEAGRASGPGRPRVGRAMMNLGMALKNRMARGCSEDELDRIVSMIDDTAAAIERS